LIHKGKYVFTNGPPLTNIVDQQLLSFEESNGDNNTDDQKKDSSGEQGLLDSEEQLSAAPSSNGETHAETPNETSEESSSDEETAIVPASTSIPPMFDFSEKSTPAASAPTEPSTKYTKEQLDEARAFLSEVQRGGKTKASNHAPVEGYASSCWTQEPPTQFSLSPDPTEREARTSSWASEVNVAEAEDRAIEVQSPSITAPLNHVPPPNTPAQKFVKDNGRRAKKGNNAFYQPNNPQHKKGGSRAESIISQKTVKIAKSTISASEPSPSISNSKSSMPKLNVLRGTVLKAQRDSPRTSKVVLDVRAGDQIRVLKHISGPMYYGKNMRTEFTGQFSEDIFKAPIPIEGAVAPKQASTPKVASPQTVASALVIAEKALAAEKAHARRVELDEIEERNAAEWDDVPVRRQKTTLPVVVKTASNVTASKFSVLEGLDTESEVKEKQERTPAKVEGLKELVGNVVLGINPSTRIRTNSNQVDRILKLHGIPTAPQPTSTAVGKTNVCW
jgi:hypothetical protein